MWAQCGHTPPPPHNRVPSRSITCLGPSPHIRVDTRHGIHVRVDTRRPDYGIRDYGILQGAKPRNIHPQYSMRLGMWEKAV